MSSAAKLSIKSKPGESRHGLKPSVVAYKRERILEVASAIFYAKGYETATLEMVADQLNVTKPFLYTYFRNKQDILAAICEVGVKESLAALDQMDDTGDTSVDRLRRALVQTCEIIIKRFEYIVVYQREMMNLDRADAQRLIRLRHEFDLQIGRLIEACVRDGHVTVSDAPAMSVWIGGLLSWISYTYRPGSRRTPEMIIDQVVTASMRIIGLN